MLTNFIELYEGNEIWWCIHQANHLIIKKTLQDALQKRDPEKKKNKKTVFHLYASLNWLIQKEPRTEDLLLKDLNFHWKSLFHL